MKPRIQLTTLAMLAGFGLVASSHATTFTTDFNSGLPSGTAVYGDAFVDGTGGVGNSGVLKITTASNGQIGSFIINDLDPGHYVNGFTATFNALIGGGTSPAADGFSLNFANNLPNAPISEEGDGTGLTVAFDSYDNGGNEAPAIDVKWGGATVGHVLTPVALGSSFFDVFVHLDTDGTLDLNYNNVPIYSNFSIPGFSPILGGRFGFGGRTGGLNENNFIDNLSISTSAIVPEPSTMLLLILGIAGLFGVRRMARK